MSYHISTTLDLTIDEAIARVTEALKEKGFGVLTTIDVAETLKMKIDVDFRPYVILGACNPHFAHQALMHEDKIGTMLPCNVIIQAVEGGGVEVSAVDPMASMQAIDNPNLGAMAVEVQGMLKDMIEGL